MERTIIDILSRMEEKLGAVSNAVDNLGKRMDIANGRLAKNETCYLDLKSDHATLKQQVETLAKENREEEEEIKRIALKHNEEMKPINTIATIFQGNWKFILWVVGVIIAANAVWDIVQDHILPLLK